MTFQTMLNTTITTYRNSANGIGIQKSYVKNLSSIRAFIQPLSPEYSLKDNALERAYKMVVSLNTDIQITDKIIDAGGKQYRVAGSYNYNFGVNAHQSYMIYEEVKSIPDI